MGKIEYIKAFYAAFPIDGGRRLGLAWAETGQPVEVAIAWHRHNYLPEEALPLIGQGMTPEMAAAGDEALIEAHGLIGATVLKLQLEHPGAEILVDPAVDEALDPDQ